MSGLGLKPNAPPDAPYTVPTIKTTDGSVITQSAAIAKALEQQHPEPSLRMNDELEAEAHQIAFQVARPLFPNYMSTAARSTVTESTVEAYSASRKQKFGMSIDEMAKKAGGDQAWTAAQPGFDAMKRLLTEKKVDDGPFIQGSKVCYADFIIVVAFEAYKQVDVGMYDRIMAMDEKFVRLYDACEAWLERAD